MNTHYFNTLSIKALTKQIYRVRLKPQKELFDFKGGQYLLLLMPNGEKIPLSIASPPEEKTFIELHIRLTPDSHLPEEMLALFKKKIDIQVEGPAGDCFLRDSKNHIIIIAGGTGFSPMKSLIESAFQQKSSCKISLYLGAQTSAELYQTDLIKSWNSEPWNSSQCEFKYIPVINQKEPNWQGSLGFPHKVALSELQSIDHCDFYIAGSEAMVMNVYQDLLNAGVHKDNIFSDMLDIKRESGDLD